MAKRRNKNKVRRRLAGFGGRDGFGLKENSVKVLSEGPDDEQATDASYVLSELTDQVQLTEMDPINGEVTEKFGKQDSSGNVVKSDGLKLKISRSDKLRQDKLKSHDEAQINPREIDGETCLDIECGANEAVLFLSKLWLGSKGACIKFMDKWLTPNEFQAISGRESAKDWKRSIRHNAKSLKVLITKGLIDIKNVPVGKKGKKRSPTKLPTNGYSDTTDEDIPFTEGQNADVCDGDVMPTRDDVTTFDDTLKKPLQDVDSVISDSVISDDYAQSNPDEAGDMKENREVTTAPLSGKPSGKIETDEPQPKKRGRKPKRQRQRHQMIIARAARKMMMMSASAKNKTIKADDKVNLVGTPVLKNDTKTPGDVTDKTPAIDNAHERETKTTVTNDVIDTRSDEERRLDGFLQTLRLTKATVSSKSGKTDPELPVINLPAGKREPVDDADDVEMPVLEKVLDLPPTIPINTETAVPTVTSPSSVDGLPSTVTPPPTPPGEKVPIEQKLVSNSDENMIATFKSRLSPTGDGLKLTINREKINLKCEEPVEYKQPSVCGQVSKEQNMQTLLLQDALQSAKKYKERLQQSKHNFPATIASSSAIHVPKVPNDHHIARSRESFSDKHIRLLSVSKQNTTQEQTNRAMHMKHSISHITTSTTSSLHNHKSAMDPHFAVGKSSGKLDKMPEFRHHTSPKHGTVPVMSEPANKSLLNNAMSHLTSMYSPQYYPADKKDAFMVALQDAYRKEDLLRHFPNGSFTGAETSPLLYPMMTQQILLAMTQRLYSMCNVPTSSVGAFVAPHDMKTSLGGKPCKTNDLDFLSRCSSANGLLQTSNQYDMASKKRKHSSVDANGALDLSMKRTKYDDKVFESFSKHNSSVHKQPDIPLDFSVKQHHITDIRSPVVSASFPNFLHYAAQSAKQHTDKYPMPSFYRSNAPIDTKPKVSDSYGSWSNHFNDMLKSQTLNPCTCDKKCIDDITTWSVNKVCDFLKTLDGCGTYAKTFQEQGISGQILPVLTTQHLTRTLGMKVGPALTLMHAVERKFREKLLAPSCSHCTRRMTPAVQI